MHAMSFSKLSPKVPSMRESQLSVDMQADDDVQVGYPSGRGTHEQPSIGANARLRSGTVIYDGVDIGDRFQTGHHVIVREECTIGNDVSIWSNSIVDYGCTIGDGVKIHCNCYIAQFSHIARDVFIAPGVTFANDLYPGFPESANNMLGPFIDEGAQIGVNATILPFVTIGKGTIIGAGSVVTSSIPAGKVAFGCPAVPVRNVAELHDIKQRVLNAAQSRSRKMNH
jgi:acetyltransferase-like isoleucine patch superfamily enzyme